MDSNHKVVSTAGEVEELGVLLPLNAVDCHVHVFDPARFPYSVPRKYTPAAATVADLERFHASLGIRRTVLVQPSVYGTDNRCLVDALKTLGDRARGIAVLPDGVSIAELEELNGAGVRGIRLNLQVNGAHEAAHARRVVDRALTLLEDTWWCLQIFAGYQILLSVADLIEQSTVPVILDHFGMAPVGCQERPEEFADFLRLLSLPNVHVKCSGPHQISRSAPEYHDVAPIATECFRAGAGRAIWGSDWPHTGGTKRSADYNWADVEPFRHEDDAKNLRSVRLWAGEEEFANVMSVNPVHLFGFVQE